MTLLPVLSPPNTYILVGLESAVGFPTIVDLVQILPSMLRLAFTW